jgi:hypothetical protein
MAGDTAAMGSGGSSAGSRLRTVARHPNARVLVLAVLIGFASILSAVVAWQASLSAIQASRYGSLATQQLTRTQQIEAELRGLIDQDLRFVNLYQEHSLAARELASQADNLRTTDPTAADELDLQAQARSDLARALRPFFLAAGNIQLQDDGTVNYDVDYVLTNLEQGNVELRELRTSNAKALADQADTRAVSLSLVAALIVAALFFLTIAQVVRTRARTQRAFIGVGGLLVLIGTVSFVFVAFFT